ncbi:MAG: ASKHA domain-containing protein [Eubacteriaceae bacterium]|jgi:uncharacterized 2Fe-2S/4Fe-4S cluster protein (DUF4445 family)
MENTNKNCTVTIETADSVEKVQVPAGTDLLTAQVMADLHPDAPCGGQGRCKKCLIDLIETDADGREQTRQVVACTYPVTRDLHVRLIAPDKMHRILTDTSDSSTETEVNPLPVQGLDNRYLVAFDIGTTTIAGFLLDGKTGGRLAEAGRLNPQAQFGADVISRCLYAQKNGRETLSRPVLEALNSLLAELAASAGIQTADISQVALCGNTAMHHLLLKLPTEKLVTAPYDCGPRNSLLLSAEESGLCTAPGSKLRILPLIGSFVGADTASCIEAVHFEQQEQPILMIDIGTNGEIVLGNRDKRLACSTAAGPAFEGANIFCGMRGAEGAIDHITFDGKDLNVHVIGGGKAKGICGSGLLDAAAACLNAELIDISGRIADPADVAPHLRFRLTSVGPVRAIKLKDGIVLTQKDIRELQLAKGAMAAGIGILLKKYGIDDASTQLGKVFIAGAFGTFLNPESACRIGLIPGELLDHIQAVGNAAGKGAQDCVLSETAMDRCLKLADETEFVELANERGFQDLYVEMMGFPES